MRGLTTSALPNSVGFWLGVAACSGAVLYLPLHLNDAEVPLPEGEPGSAENRGARM